MLEETNVTDSVHLEDSNVSVEQLPQGSVFLPFPSLQNPNSLTFSNFQAENKSTDSISSAAQDPTPEEPQVEIEPTKE